MPASQSSAAHESTARVLQHGRVSTTSGIASAVVSKNDQLSFLCELNGDVPMGGSHGYGLYYHDCRYLNGYELRLDGQPGDPLTSTAAAGSWTTFELTNPDLHLDSGLIEKESVGIKWERTLDADAVALHDSLVFTNFSAKAIALPLSIALRSRFESLFEVRGAKPEKRGTLHDPAWRDDALVFAYDGADHVRRELRACFSPAPDDTDEAKASFEISLEPDETKKLAITLSIVETERGDAPDAGSTATDVAATRQKLDAAAERWIDDATRIESDGEMLNAVLNRSLRDLHVLRTELRGRHYFAAGVPWYVTLFGRDSLIAAIEALAYLPHVAEDTIRLLASYQGTQEDDWRDEQPGKIMHELRVGEMAHLNEVPQTPYYGSVDATPLFLILLTQHAVWTGRLDLFADMKDHVEAALRWIDEYGDRAGNGYLSYARKSSNGLANQGWKDSGDSIVNADGSLATSPIALVEVQGYVYLAKRGLADLYRRTGDRRTAARLDDEATALRDRINEDFWVEELGTYALALQQHDAPAAVVTSNPGQALWTGIATPDRAKRTVERLMRDDMYSGWGIRTLSSGERRYNPIGYHVGTVWPHDNAIIAAGFRRYGFAEQARRVMSGIIDAATDFTHDRLPEVFAGFSREEFEMPVRYPVACHPQAWAAGAVPFMLPSVLGLEPNAFERRLKIVHPLLPEHVTRLSVERLRIGDATVRLAFESDKKGHVAVADVKVDGRLDVVVED